MGLVKKSENTAGRAVWIDWVLLILLVIAVFFGVRYLYGRRQAATPTVTVDYTLCLSALDGNLIALQGSAESLIPVGAAVSNANGTAQLGRVTAVQVRPHFTVTVRDGEAVTVEHPEKFDLFVSVRGSATERAGDGLRIHDIRISAGESGDYYIGSFYAAGAVTVSVEERS